MNKCIKKTQYFRNELYLHINTQNSTVFVSDYGTCAYSNSPTYI